MHAIAAMRDVSSAYPISIAPLLPFDLGHDKKTRRVSSFPASWHATPLALCYRLSRPRFPLQKESRVGGLCPALAYHLLLSFSLQYCFNDPTEPAFATAFLFALQR